MLTSTALRSREVGLRMECHSDVRNLCAVGELRGKIGCVGGCSAPEQIMQYNDNCNPGGWCRAAVYTSLGASSLV